MKVRRIQPARVGLFVFAALWMFILVPLSVAAAPYAAMVVDARSGEVLHSRNADTRLHPASLTKMMTLYIAFEAVRNGEISLDTKVKISSHAASEPPSKLGLKSGQTIAFRYLIRAAAVKSANDAATAIGEAISGSEAKFARRMTRTAHAMGMTRTTFKNAHGLTESGHLSTARDMTLLGRHLLFDYPEYYNLFSRTSTHAGIREVSNTNRRLLAAYKGADGIKTGYTRAAGFNLVASAVRGNERIIATVFGGQSTAQRNAKVAELLDLGFRRAPSRAKTVKPAAPNYIAEAKDPAGSSDTATASGAYGKTIRLVTAVPKSLRPQARPTTEPVLVAEAQADEAAIRDQIGAALAQVQSTKPATPAPASAATTASAVNQAVAVAVADNAKQAKPIQTPLTETETLQLAATKAESLKTATELAATTSLRPEARPSDIVLASVDTSANLSSDPEVVTRVSTSGGRHWGINVGRYNTRYEAERVLLKTALAEMSTLDDSLRKVVKRPQGFDANFLGMTKESADLACRRLQARNVSCFMVGPG
ncbi:hypothetical protein SuNHUV7_09900 (plasmid) [Pseudoseohaeicola sp. NH-UV-7]|uniref:D-alanyl-D-alanine carboxypeptidase family protein n=1 Tax=unclassified Sulfitobacter TaxID=196795 RepID=UPI0026C555A7